MPTDLGFTVLIKPQTIVTDDRSFLVVEIGRRVLLALLKARNTMKHNREALLWQQVRLEQET